jgi:predicted LPLAT superfamily acyltransferase
MSEATSEAKEGEARLAERPGGWLAVRERGTILGVRIAVFLVTVLGRTLPRLVVVPIVASYYALFAREAREAQRGFLRRLHGREPTFLEIYRQFRRFVLSTFDAFFIVSGKHHHFTTRSTGNEHLERRRDANEGAILLGAHLGSFQALRMRGGQRGFRLYAVVLTKNARMLNDALRELDPDDATTLLEMPEDGGMDFMLRIKELVEGGAMVAILADRVHGAARSVAADFLGEKALFPAGPFLLASMLRCPVYLVFGFAEGARHYEFLCEPFADPVELPRKGREEALAGYVQRYAARLEHHARQRPDNWFNYFDFWKK